MGNARYRIIRGKVQKGKGLGRKLGFPTANMHRPAHAPEGIFIGYSLERWCLVCIKNEVEVFFPNYTKNLYGTWLSVRLVKKIRNFKHFSSLPALIQAMNNDLQCLQELLKKQHLSRP